MNEDQRKLEMKKQFLSNHIFTGLENLNDGFDSPNISYFSEEDFAAVLKRVKKLGLGIYGIEPWKTCKFYDAKVYEEVTEDPTDSNWYEEAFRDFKNTDGQLLYAATYYVPENLLKDHL